MFRPIAGPVGSLAGDRPCASLGEWAFQTSTLVQRLRDRGRADVWKFVVVRDKAINSKVAAACNWRRADGSLVSQAWVDEAPVIIVACGFEQQAAVRYYKQGQVITANWAALEAEMAQGPIEYESAMLYDLAIALDHLTLAAAAEGLGTCWIGGLDEPQMKEILSIPEDVRAPIAMTVGYPVSWPQPRPRKSLDEIVCYDQFS